MGTVVVEASIKAEKTQLYIAKPPRWLTMISIAVATTVASIEAISKLSMMPAVTSITRCRDMEILLTARG